MSKYRLIWPFLFLVIFIAINPINFSNFNNLAQGEGGLAEDNYRYPSIYHDSLLAQNYSLLRKSSPNISRAKNLKTIKILVTAYSSCPEETDDTPLITASGSYVRPGVVAANFLPLGTKIRLPKVFGDQIFVVEDRLNRIYNDRVDIWFPSKAEALEFGHQITELEIL